MKELFLTSQKLRIAILAKCLLTLIFLALPMNAQALNSTNNNTSCWQDKFYQSEINKNDLASMRKCHKAQTDIQRYCARGAHSLSCAHALATLNATCSQDQTSAALKKIVKKHDGMLYKRLTKDMKIRSSRGR